MPTNCWNTETIRPIQTMLATLPCGVLRSRQDGSVSRSMDSRIRLIFSSMFASPSSRVSTAVAAGIRCLEMRKRGDSGIVYESRP